MKGEDETEELKEIIDSLPELSNLRHDKSVFRLLHDEDSTRCGAMSGAPSEALKINHSKI